MIVLQNYSLLDIARPVSQTRVQLTVVLSPSFIYIEYVCPTWLVEVASSISIFFVADEKIPRPGGSEVRVAHTGDLLQIVHTCHLLRGPDLILGESDLVVPLFALGTLVILLKTMSFLFIWTLFTESAAHAAHLHKLGLNPFFL